MRILPILIILLSTSALTNAQELHVTKSKKVFLKGQKVKKGDTLIYSDIVFVKPNGTMTLLGTSSKPMSLNQGTHELGTKYLEHLEQYQHHDSLFNQLKLMGLSNCEFPYEYVLVTHNAHTLVGQIEIERYASVPEDRRHSYFAFINTMEQDSILIKWRNPDEKYTGKYFMLIEDFFEDFRELIAIEENSYLLDLKPYILDETTLLLIKIIAEDCRESDFTGLGLQHY